MRETFPQVDRMAVVGRPQGETRLRWIISYSLMIGTKLRAMGLTKEIAPLISIIKRGNRIITIKNHRSKAV